MRGFPRRASGTCALTRQTGGPKDEYGRLFVCHQSGPVSCYFWASLFGAHVQTTFDQMEKGGGMISIRDAISISSSISGSLAMSEVLPTRRILFFESKTNRLPTRALAWAWT